MIMKTWITILLCIGFIDAYAGGGDEIYNVANIPAGLMKNANVVKRTEDIRFEITEKNRAWSRKKVAYTILNEQGEEWAYFFMGYDKLRSIESFEGSLFDASGKKIK